MSEKSLRVLDQNGEAIDYTKRAPTFNGVRLRTHESVLVRTEEPLDVPALVSRAKGDGGAQWFYEKIRELARKRQTLAARRRSGDACRDEEAESLSFATVKDMQALRRALDFDIVVHVPAENGKRSITTSAFALLTSSMAVADVNMAYESVPTVVEKLVRDLDDSAEHTEVGQVLQFPHLVDPTADPIPLKETEALKEVTAGEDRYTVLSFRDGYLAKFSQALIDRGGPRVFNDLMDLGQGVRECLELFGLKKIIDYHGSKGTSQRSHVMIRNRAAAALFSSTTNTPSTRAPNGTRIENNALVDTSNLSVMRRRLASMRSSRNTPIANWPEIVLTPDALWETSWKLLNSVQQPGVMNEGNFWGPGGPGGPIQHVSTPFLDLLTTTCWYAGRPQLEFVRKWKKRPEVAVHGGKDTEMYVTTRQGMIVSVDWDMQIGVRDHVFWVENLPGTTPPGGA